MPKTADARLPKGSHKAFTAVLLALREVFSSKTIPSKSRRDVAKVVAALLNASIRSIDKNGAWPGVIEAAAPPPIKLTGLPKLPKLPAPRSRTASPPTAAPSPKKPRLTAHGKRIGRPAGSKNRPKPPAIGSLHAAEINYDPAHGFEPLGAAEE